MRTGLDALAERDFAELRGRRVVVLSNPTGVMVREGRVLHGVDAMVAAGVEVVGVFGPEHGFRGTATAGESEADAFDPVTSVPLLDAYHAGPEHLAEALVRLGAHVVVVDLQDAGVRFYTYVWTMYRLMMAVARVPAVAMLVLDRPNPLGRARRGGLLAPGLESSIGRRSILHQHGLTLGELARVLNAHHLPEEPGGTSIDLSVVPVEGWDGSARSSGAPGWPLWVAPSPNLPTVESCLAYPGTGLLEAVTLSEGRGTTRPFTLLAAPWVDDRWLARLDEGRHPGALLREAAFEPLAVPHFETHAGRLCRGVEVHVTDPDEFDAVRFGVDLLTSARDLYPELTHRGDQWRWLDLMTGRRQFARDLLAGAGTDDLLGGWLPDQRAWDEQVGSLR
ncbi:exo-beta-N-acetylmuramidase NamZ family protein [Aestuariimicrobium kwangyangense]|uniref:exo-beta-N-acetylmuramidase NamZ family protein n=1 Tax=Aestuariimicrobium kwangyangense TaxID=396389 RepID=UPI0003B35A0F|nr:DUF1343 domain-containing protein [Aestuariimicrobium kwangyangense]